MRTNAHWLRPRASPVPSPPRPCGRGFPTSRLLPTPWMGSLLQPYAGPTRHLLGAAAAGARGAGPQVLCSRDMRLCCCRVGSVRPQLRPRWGRSDQVVTAEGLVWEDAEGWFEIRGIKAREPAQAPPPSLFRPPLLLGNLGAVLPPTDLPGPGESPPGERALGGRWRQVGQLLSASFLSGAPRSSGSEWGGSPPPLQEDRHPGFAEPCWAALLQQAC